ncbi:hypothetical protein P167DRAFT_532578 [Morchella conica CCBAS932]|uniref:Uncharacterized protein n=1 Tax=Morchella conica CCBAS932 TaxID=1392247 RepID=A0A3N4L2Y2_9PEZI|nr:hypothetical protein P167DRAFT_532578 [Morchella conica CCBAS932]
MRIPLAFLLRVTLFTLLTLTTRAARNLNDSSTNSCYDSCKDPFDTFVVCGVPFSPDEDMRIYMNISYYTPTQSNCLCMTRGFLRSALEYIDPNRII